MNGIRKPRVAGMFYPDSKTELHQEISAFLEQVVLPPLPRDVRAIISPHAGYVYSGSCAAFSYSTLSHSNFKTAIILAPSHHSNRFIFSPALYSHFETPLGLVKVNQDWMDALMQYPECQFEASAHEKEHAVEVQLPFLQMTLPHVEIVPILLGQQSPANSQMLISIISGISQKCSDQPLIIISTDLSHYYSSAAAHQMDFLLQEDLHSLRFSNLQEHFYQNRIEACGIGGLFAMLAYSQTLTAPQFTILKYQHSGTVNHDNSKVVGYLAGVLTEGV